MKAKNCSCDYMLFNAQGMDPTKKEGGGGGGCCGSLDEDATSVPAAWDQETRKRRCD